jgi:nucleoside phosphorylase
MNILIITPMLKEYHSARETFSAKEISIPGGFRISQFLIHGNSFYILLCLKHVNEALDQFSESFGIPDLLIDSGSCGSLNNSIHLGDIVHGITFKNEESEGHSEFLETSFHDTQVPDVCILEVYQGVLSDFQKSLLQNQADVCNMESYRIFEKSLLWKCEFLSIRIVTDLADDQGMSEFKKNIRPYCMKLYAYLKDFLMNISH